MKIFAAVTVLAGVFAFSGIPAHAQTTSQEAAPITNSKAQQRAETKRADKPRGQVPAPGGDMAGTAKAVR